MLSSEDFAYFRIPEIMRNDSEKVRFSQLESYTQQILTNNASRIGFLKRSFADIIEFLTHKEAKSYIVAFKSKFLYDYRPEYEKILIKSQRLSHA